MNASSAIARATGFALHSRGLEPDGTRQPPQAGFALHSRRLESDGKRRIPDL